MRRRCVSYRFPMSDRRSWQPPHLADVAALAGVSSATASRVLSGSQAVGRGRTQVVLEAARRLGYRAHLADPHRGCVAVFAAATDRLGYSNTLAGVIDAARDEELLVEIYIIDSGGPAGMSALLDRALSQPLTGVVVVEFDSLAVQLLAELPTEIPVSVAGGVATDDSDRWAHSYIDDQAGAYHATEALLAEGHRSVHYLGVPDAGHTEPRQQGWRAALQAAGAPVHPVLGIGWSAARGRRAARAIPTDGSVTAVLCGNDDLAVGLIAGLVELGRSVPEEISVVGFDDHPLAVHCQVPLTTVRQDFGQLGRTALMLLGELADGQPARRVEIPTELIYRASTRGC